MTKVLTRTVQKSQESMNLSYEFSINPSPIVVTPTNADSDVISKADISMVMTNDDYTDVTFNEIQIHFTLGKDKIGSDFLTNSIDKLSVIFEHEDLEVIKSGGNYFTLQSKKKSSFTLKEDESLFMVFHCKKVSTKVGNFIITLMEKEKEGGRAEREFFFGKFPYGFFLNNFRASQPIVNYGSSAILRWDGSRDSNTTYYLCSNTPIIQKGEKKFNSCELLYSYNEDCFERTQTKSCEKVWDLTETSFYTLKAQYKINGKLAEYYMQTSVYVKDSDVTTTHLNVLDSSTLNGQTTVNTNSTLKGDSNIVDNHSFCIQGTGTSVFSSNIQMLGEKILIEKFGSYIANTDGFVVGYIEADGHDDRTLNSLVRLSVTCDGITMSATGGSFTVGPNFDIYPMSNSVTFPIKKGSTFNLHRDIWQKSKMPSHDIYFIPFGEHAKITKQPIKKV